jgi:hypothetical protein
MRRFLPIVLAAFCLISAGRLLLESLRLFNSSNGSNDMVTSWDAHMRLVQAALPLDVTIVSYLENADLKGSTSMHDFAEYFLTQYGLAPIALQRGFDPDWIVGNFGHTLAHHKLSVLDRMLGPHTTQDFGFGIYLIHKVSR